MFPPMACLAKPPHIEWLGVVVVMPVYPAARPARLAVLRLTLPPIADGVVQDGVRGPLLGILCIPLPLGGAHRSKPGIGGPISFMAGLHPWVFLKPLGIIFAIIVHFRRAIFANLCLVALLAPAPDAGIKLARAADLAAYFTCVLHDS